MAAEHLRELLGELIVLLPGPIGDARQRGFRFLSPQRVPAIDANIDQRQHAHDGFFEAAAVDRALALAKGLQQALAHVVAEMPLLTPRTLPSQRAMFIPLVCPD